MYAIPRDKLFFFWSKISYDWKVIVLNFIPLWEWMWHPTACFMLRGVETLIFLSSHRNMHVNKKYVIKMMLCILKHFRSSYSFLKMYKVLILWVAQEFKGYSTTGPPYFWRLSAFSQKRKQLWTKYPMDLVRNVPRN